MTKQTFLQGTFILIIAGFITRILGFINRIVIARVMGEEGVGLYMMAVPTFLLVITLTQIGLPIAISKSVAEAEAIGDRRKVKQILVVSLSITGFLSVVLSALLIAIAPYLSRYLLADPRTYYPLVAILPVVPIIAISSVLRGYFQGKQNMRPAAYSSVIEQTVRILLVAYCTNVFMPYGIEYAAAGAMISAVFGELASLIYILSMFKIKKTFKLRKNFFNSLKGSKKALNELLSVALPTTGSRLIGSIALFFEPILVSQSLLIAGLSVGAATSQYGLISGYVLPLLFLPSFITYSLSVSLVPAISEALVMKQFALVEHRLQQSIRLSLVSGGAAVIIIYVFAEPLLQVMFKSDKASGMLQLMAPFFLFYYFQGPLQAALQALDCAKAGMVNTLIGAIVKSILIVLLATLPSLQITGVALAISVGVVLTTLLHFTTVLKHIPFTIKATDYIKMIVAMLFGGYIGQLFYYKINFGNLHLNLIAGVIFTLLFYSFLLIIFNLVKRNELSRIPILKLVFR
ncbi:MAG: stage sporulation protein [Bacillales bacterium]|jgi:stage V sporulation protein B|nr:stage sporulation protein [Bacillales bacterium]